MPSVYYNALERRQKGELVLCIIKKVVTSFFSLGIERIQSQCNEVVNKYLLSWNLKGSELMTEYGLSLTYKQGSLELEPPFSLFEPSSIEVNILDSYHPTNRDIPAITQHSVDSRLNPKLIIFLEALEIEGTKIT